MLQLEKHSFGNAGVSLQMVLANSAYTVEQKQLF